MADIYNPPYAVLRAAGGIWDIVGWDGGLVLAEREPAKFIVHETKAPFDDGTAGDISFPINSKQWSIDRPRKIIHGLWHLEGETVSILGDGNVFPPQVVVNGSITLPEYVTRCIVGLMYTVRAKTLPLTVQGVVVEGRRKIVNALALRMQNTLGLQNGRALDDLYPMRTRTDEKPGQPTRMINGVEHQIISTNWDDNGQTYFVQTDPLPVTLLSVITEVEVGDDPD